MILRFVLAASAAAVLACSAFEADAKPSYSGGGGGATNARSCLKPAVRSVLSRIEQQFGHVQIVSACRRGARIRGTGKVSKHASGEAVDFNAPGGKKAAVVRWLIANHKGGGTMTYRNFSHIHVDVGYRFVRLGATG